MTVTKTTKKPQQVAREEKKQKKRRGKKRTSPFQRAPSAFIIFTTGRRPEIKKQYPDASFGDISKMVGKEWRELPDNLKKPFEDQAGEAKVKADQYNRKVREEHPELVEEYQAEKRRKIGGSKKSSNRGPNNFLLFSHSVRNKVRDQYPDKTPSELQKEIGKMWAELSPSDKQFWTEKWRENKSAREAAAAVISAETD